MIQNDMDEVDFTDLMLVGGILEGDPLDTFLPFDSENESYVPSSPEYFSVPYDESPGNERTQRPCMTSEQWVDAIGKAISALKTFQPIQSPVTLNHFSKDSAHRYRAKTELLKKLVIFPMFLGEQRYRENFGSKKRHPYNMNDVVDALNFFLSRKFSEDEILFLQNYYRTMEIPMICHCLSPICFIFDTFCRNFRLEKVSRSQQPMRIPEIVPRIENPVPARVTSDSLTSKSSRISFEDETLVSLLDHINQTKEMVRFLVKHLPDEQKKMFLAEFPNEIGLMSGGDIPNIPSKKRCASPGYDRAQWFRIRAEDYPSGNIPTNIPSKKGCALPGNDRAQWFRIRDEDYPTRNSWCIPGGVFAVYDDGVGPLLPTHLRHRISVVVYSVDPDIIEAHPDPANADRFVLVAMVGEVPVSLRPDQMRKLLKWNCRCQLFVSHHGEVKVRRYVTRHGVEKRPPSGGTVFATVDLADTLKLNEHGQPTFQGVPESVCATFQLRSSRIVYPNRVSGVFHKASRGVRRVYYNAWDTADLNVLDLMKYRDRLYRELASLEDQKAIYKSMKKPSLWKMLRSLSKQPPQHTSVPPQTEDPPVESSVVHDEAPVISTYHAYKQELKRLNQEINRTGLLLKR